MARLKRSFEEWWLSPAREWLGSALVFLPVLLALLISLILGWFSLKGAK